VFRRNTFCDAVLTARRVRNYEACHQKGPKKVNQIGKESELHSWSAQFESRTCNRQPAVLWFSTSCQVSIPPLKIVLYFNTVFRPDPVTVQALYTATQASDARKFAIQNRKQLAKLGRTVYVTYLRCFHL